ncbi:MAG: ATPase, T2SS/T4P/T4SS family [Desulfatiglandaceae bacterium]
MQRVSKLRIGELLIQEGAITQEQLEKALAVQKRQKVYKPLGEVCVELRLITRPHLHRILNRYQKRISLGDLLINLGLITPDQLHEALMEQKKSGGKLGEILVHKGFIAESALVDALSIQMGILKVAPDFHLIDKTLLKGLNEEFLIRNEIIPAFKEDGALTLIMSNPLDQDLIQNLGRVFNVKKIRPAIASSTDIKHAIHQHFQTVSFGEKAASSREKKDLIIGDRKISVEAEDSTTGIVDYIITNAILEGASDIHIEPREQGIRVRYRIDGILHHKTDLPISLALSLASRIKVLCKLDIAEKRRHQDGRIQAQVMDKEVDLRVSVYASAFGENIVIRILYRKSDLIDIDQLGISPRNKIHFLQILDQPTGVILVTGPTGSGKTTTLYAAINYLNDGKTSIITVEDPVEYVIDGVVQGQLHSKLGHTYVDFIRSMMRQDPDVIMVGEIRDPTAAEAVIQSALTGHKVLTTFHTEDTTGALLRLMDMGIDTFLISSTVISVMAQRLVRVLCDDCKEAYIPSSHELDALGVRAENVEKYKFYKPVGCPRCNHMGFRGRTGVHELLLVNDMVRDAILARKTSGEIRRLAREGASLVTMREDGFYKVFKGITSFDEVSRVVPWQEIDEAFRRSPEEIIALSEGDTALQEMAAGSMDDTVPADAAPDFTPDDMCRIRFDTRTIEQERERIARFFEAYRQMMEKLGQSLDPSRVMEDFIEFILFTVKRVEQALHSRFVEFSLREKEGKLVMELETLVPKQLSLPAMRRPRDQGPRLIHFLLPTNEVSLKKGGPSAGTENEPASPSEGGHASEQRTVLYKKHVEELKWKIPSDP